MKKEFKSCLNDRPIGSTPRPDSQSPSGDGGKGLANAEQYDDAGSPRELPRDKPAVLFGIDALSTDYLSLSRSPVSDTMLVPMVMPYASPL